MIASSFEIKVALLGYVSVGKTTVLNALFQDKFSEVSMRRTTAAINLFRISTSKQETETSGSSCIEESCKEEIWSPNTGEVQDASSTLQETIADNKILRTTNELKEKTFDIELERPFVCEMREDTSLVIVDVPGLNEAGTSDMYLDYVRQHWDTFDCVVVVMDAEKGVNTDEQVSLLEFVKEQQQLCSDIPVIVLCNKVDDPSNEEIASLVEEVREKVEDVFKVDCSTAALDKILTPPTNRASTKEGTPSTNDVKSSEPHHPTFSFGTSSSSTATKTSTEPSSETSSFSFGSGWKPGSAPLDTSTNGTESFAAKPVFTFPTTTTNSKGCNAETQSFSFGSGWKPGAFSFGGGSTPLGISTKGTKSQCKSAAKFQFPMGTSASIRKNAESPVFFIPISAENAFVYRTVSRLPLKDFSLLDKDILERLGREEAGRMRWKAMYVEEKYGVVHDAVSDPNAYKERLQSTNFNRFLKVLEHVVGGVETQTRILQKQLDVAARKVEQGNHGLAEQLRSIYERSKALGKPANHLATQFWSVYKQVEVDAFESLQNDFNLQPLYRCMNELIEFAKPENHVLFAGGTNETLKAEYQRISEVARNLVTRQCLIIVQQHANWKVEESSFMSTEVMEISSNRSSAVLRSPAGSSGGYRSSRGVSFQPGANPRAPERHPFYWSPVNKSLALDSDSQTWTHKLTGQLVKSKRNPDLPMPSWTNLSPDDWMTVVNSILLMAHDPRFAESFGAEMNELDLVKAQLFLYPSQATQTRTNYLAGEYKDGVFVPNDPTKYCLVKQLGIPKGLDNVEHWGHLAWMYCRFKKSLEAYE